MCEEPPKRAEAQLKQPRQQPPEVTTHKPKKQQLAHREHSQAWKNLLPARPRAGGHPPRKHSSNSSPRQSPRHGRQQASEDLAKTRSKHRKREELIAKRTHQGKRESCWKRAPRRCTAHEGAEYHQ